MVGYVAPVIPPVMRMNESHPRFLFAEDHVFHTGYEQIFLDIVRQHRRDHHFSFDSKATDEK
jgi:hypothetical protein